MTGVEWDGMGWGYEIVLGGEQSEKKKERKKDERRSLRECVAGQARCG